MGQTFWKDGILNTNTKGQRFEAEELCAQLGGPLIRERFAQPAERRADLPGLRNGKNVYSGGVVDKFESAGHSHREGGAWSGPWPPFRVPRGP